VQEAELLLGPLEPGAPRFAAPILANLSFLAEPEHPGIARLLDGGVTEAGLPWLAMDCVDGMPIERYCDEQESDIEERLSLFRAVCDAVQHAQRETIVHRDLVRERTGCGAAAIVP
jgi:serine/threonine protein kinase